MPLHRTARIGAIAVPVSSPADGTIDLAAHLAQRCGAMVHLLSARPDPALERRARELGVPAEVAVLAGPLEPAGIDLVVVGSDGFGFWTRLLHRSVAGNLSRDASVPVLVAPRELDLAGLAARGFRRVIVGTSDRAVADLGGRLAAALAISGATIEFVHVIDSGVATEIDGLAELVADVAPDGCTSHPVIERGEVAEAIVRRATEHDADLIILGSRPHGTAGDRLLGTTADKVLHDAPCCVLAIPEVVLAEHRQRSDRERRIDEALEESFPASDPPSFTA